MEDTLRRFVPCGGVGRVHPRRLAGTALAGLWVAGDLGALAAPTVAVVGTRAPSEDGRRLAQRLAGALGAAGVCVILGPGAWDRTLPPTAAPWPRKPPRSASWAGGHDHFFPPRNAELARRMVAVAAGRLALPAGSPSLPVAVPGPQRNRCGAGDGVCRRRGGGPQRGHQHRLLGRRPRHPGDGLPGDVDRPKVAGCLALIRDGATLVRDAADVLAQLGIAAPRRSRPGRPPPPAIRSAPAC